MPTATYRALYAVAQRQTGFVTTAQAARVGVQPMTLVMMRKRGALSRVSRGVYRFVDFPALPLARYVAATLWPYEVQGVLSHETALALHQLFAASSSDVHITVPAGFRIQRRVPTDLVVHRGDLTETEIGCLDCVPITTPERTIRDCIAAGVEAAVVFTSIENGLRTGVFNAATAMKLRKHMPKQPSLLEGMPVGLRRSAAPVSTAPPGDVASSFRSEGLITHRSSAKQPRAQGLTTTPERSALFRRVRQRGTAPEEIVQRVLTQLGHAYLKNVRGIPGSPDIVSADRSRAVFVHGCYWHRHPGCKASSTPTHNFGFWREKFEANVRRDRRKVRQLRALGYRVMTVWECQTKSEAKRIRLERRLDRFFREPR